MSRENIVDGVQNAPHRSLFHALGLTEEEQARPLIGIVSSYNEIVPGHMNIDKIVEAVKLGVAMAGGTPIVFPAIAVCDGIAMGHTGMKYSHAISLPILPRLWRSLTALTLLSWCRTAIRTSPVCSWRRHESMCLPYLSAAVLCSQAG